MKARNVMSPVLLLLALLCLVGTPAMGSADEGKEGGASSRFCRQIGLMVAGADELEGDAPGRLAMAVINTTTTTTMTPTTRNVEIEEQHALALHCLMAQPLATWEDFVCLTSTSVDAWTGAPVSTELFSVCQTMAAASSNSGGTSWVFNATWWTPVRSCLVLEGLTTPSDVCAAYPGLSYWATAQSNPSHSSSWCLDTTSVLTLTDLYAAGTPAPGVDRRHLLVVPDSTHFQVTGKGKDEETLRTIIAPAIQGLWATAASQMSTSLSIPHIGFVYLPRLVFQYTLTTVSAAASAEAATTRQAERIWLDVQLATVEVLLSEIAAANSETQGGVSVTWLGHTATVAFQQDTTSFTFSVAKTIRALDSLIGFPSPLCSSHPYSLSTTSSGNISTPLHHNLLLLDPLTPRVSLCNNATFLAHGGSLASQEGQKQEGLQLWETQDAQLLDTLAALQEETTNTTTTTSLRVVTTGNSGSMLEAYRTGVHLSYSLALQQEEELQSGGFSQGNDKKHHHCVVLQTTARSASRRMSSTMIPLASALHDSGFSVASTNSDVEMPPDSMPTSTTSFGTISFSTIDDALERSSSTNFLPSSVNCLLIEGLPLSNGTSLNRVKELLLNATTAKTGVAAAVNNNVRTFGVLDSPYALLGGGSDTANPVPGSWNHWVRSVLLPHVQKQANTATTTSNASWVSPRMFQSAAGTTNVTGVPLLVNYTSTFEDIFSATAETTTISLFSAGLANAAQQQQRLQTTTHVAADLDVLTLAQLEGKENAGQPWVHSMYSDIPVRNGHVGATSSGGEEGDSSAVSPAGASGSGGDVFSLLIPVGNSDEAAGEELWLWTFNTTEFTSGGATLHSYNPQQDVAFSQRNGIGGGMQGGPTDGSALPAWASATWGDLSVFGTSTSTNSYSTWILNQSSADSASWSGPSSWTALPTVALETTSSTTTNGVSGGVEPVVTLTGAAGVFLLSPAPVRSENDVATSSSSSTISNASWFSFQSGTWESVPSKTSSSSTRRAMGGGPVTTSADLHHGRFGLRGPCQTVSSRLNRTSTELASFTSAASGVTYSALHWSFLICASGVYAVGATSAHHLAGPVLITEKIPSEVNLAIYGYSQASSADISPRPSSTSPLLGAILTGDGDRIILLTRNQSLASTSGSATTDSSANNATTQAAMYPFHGTFVLDIKSTTRSWVSLPSSPSLVKALAKAHGYPDPTIGAARTDTTISQKVFTFLGSCVATSLEFGHLVCSTTTPSSPATGAAAWQQTSLPSWIAKAGIMDNSWAASLRAIPFPTTTSSTNRMLSSSSCSAVSRNEVPNTLGTGCVTCPTGEYAESSACLPCPYQSGFQQFFIPKNQFCSRVSTWYNGTVIFGLFFFSVAIILVAMHVKFVGLALVKQLQMFKETEAFAEDLAVLSLYNPQTLKCVIGDPIVEGHRISDPVEAAVKTPIWMIIGEALSDTVLHGGGEGMASADYESYGRDGQSGLGSDKVSHVQKRSSMMNLLDTRGQRTKSLEDSNSANNGWVRSEGENSSSGAGGDELEKNQLEGGWCKKKLQPTHLHYCLLAIWRTMVGFEMCLPFSVRAILDDTTGTAPMHGGAAKGPGLGGGSNYGGTSAYGGGGGGGGASAKSGSFTIDGASASLRGKDTASFRYIKQRGGGTRKVIDPWRRLDLSRGDVNKRVIAVCYIGFSSLNYALQDELDTFYDFRHATPSKGQGFVPAARRKTEMVNQDRHWVHDLFDTYLTVLYEVSKVYNGNVVMSQGDSCLVTFRTVLGQSLGVHRAARFALKMLQMLEPRLPDMVNLSAGLGQDRGIEGRAGSANILINSGVSEAASLQRAGRKYTCSKILVTLTLYEHVQKNFGLRLLGQVCLDDINKVQVMEIVGEKGFTSGANGTSQQQQAIDAALQRQKQQQSTLQMVNNNKQLVKTPAASPRRATLVLPPGYDDGVRSGGASRDHSPTGSPRNSTRRRGSDFRSAPLTMSPDDGCVGPPMIQSPVSPVVDSGEGAYAEGEGEYEDYHLPLHLQPVGGGGYNSMSGSPGGPREFSAGFDDDDSRGGGTNSFGLATFGGGWMPGVAGATGVGGGSGGFELFPPTNHSDGEPGSPPSTSEGNLGQPSSNTDSQSRSDAASAGGNNSVTTIVPFLPSLEVTPGSPEASQRKHNVTDVSGGAVSKNISKNVSFTAPQGGLGRDMSPPGLIPMETVDESSGAFGGGMTNTSMHNMNSSMNMSMRDQMVMEASLDCTTAPGTREQLLHDAIVEATVMGDMEKAEHLTAQLRVEERNEFVRSISAQASPRPHSRSQSVAMPNSHTTSPSSHGSTRSRRRSTSVSHQGMPLMPPRRYSQLSGGAASPTSLSPASTPPDASVTVTTTTFAATTGADPPLGLAVLQVGQSIRPELPEHPGSGSLYPAPRASILSINSHDADSNDSSTGSTAAAPPEEAQ